MGLADIGQGADGQRLGGKMREKKFEFSLSTTLKRVGGEKGDAPNGRGDWSSLGKCSCKCDDWKSLFFSLLLCSFTSK